MSTDSVAFVTGITGFVGSHLARSLLAEDVEVVGLQHDLKKRNYLDLLGLRDKVNLVTGDICDVKFLQRVLVDYSIDDVYHLAAVSIVSRAIEYPMHTYETNVFGTLALLEAARSSPRQLHAFLSVATDKVYGDMVEAKEEYALDGRGIYESSKVCMDYISKAYFYQYGLPVVISRACNIYGLDPYNRRIIPNTLKMVLHGESPIIFEGEDTKREYIHVDDVCSAYIALVENIEKTKGQSYNVGTGHIQTQEDLVNLILQVGNTVLGGDLKPWYVKRDKPLREIQNQSLDSSKIRRDIGWSPQVSLVEGLSRTFIEFMEKGLEDE